MWVSSLSSSRECDCWCDQRRVGHVSSYESGSYESGHGLAMGLAVVLAASVRLWIQAWSSNRGCGQGSGGESGCE